MYRTLERGASLLAQALALLGGAALVALVVMTCLSISGRSLTALGLNQIPGDFELMELGVGFAVFCFLPWTQFSRGQARVDMFEPVFPPRLNALLDLVADLAALAVAGLIAWRLYLGTLDKLSYQETTFILQAPIWQAYAAACVGSAGFVLVSAFCVVRSARAVAG